MLVGVQLPLAVYIVITWGSRLLTSVHIGLETADMAENTAKSDNVSVNGSVNGSSVGENMTSSHCMEYSPCRAPKYER